MSEASLEIRDLVKTYVEGEEPAVKAVSFKVANGEFVSLLGPSGCGKTTTLRCIAGLEDVTSGEIVIGGQVVSSRDAAVPPDRRHIGMVFQSYALWPHMKAIDIVAYPLRRRGTSKKQAREQAAEVLQTVGLAGFESRYPHELSGGQQQRVAVGRAVVGKPAVLLFDEPLSNLDARLREHMRFELRELQARLGVTSLYVTHDQAEAMVLSDRIILMHQGNIMQVGPPAELYQHPRSRWAASFLGSINLVSGIIEEVRDGDVVVVSSILGRHQGVARGPAAPGDPTTIAVRPQFLDFAPQTSAHFEAVVRDIVYLGESVEYVIETEGIELRVIDDRPRPAAIGATVGIAVDADGITCLTPDDDPAPASQSNQVDVSSVRGEAT